MVKKDFLTKLKQEGIIFADGAMGTVLQEKGLSPGAAPEEWNISHQEEILSVHQSYLKAGAEIILTNTFGANRLKLRKVSLEKKAKELNRAGAEIAQKAIENFPDCYLAGDIGPSGELIQPLGKISPEEIYEVFTEQATILANAGVEIIILETFTSLQEIEIAARAVKENTELPLIASLSFFGGVRTMMGDRIKEIVEHLEKHADVLGSNCGEGVEEIIKVINEFHKFTQKPLIAKPNAGRPVLKDGKTIFKEKPSFIADRIPAIIESGAKIIGGCCGTTPAHIKAMVNKGSGLDI